MRIFVIVRSRTILRRKPFGDQLAGSVCCGGEVLQLPKPACDRRHCFGVIQVDGWLEAYSWDHFSIYIGKAEARMTDHDMAAAPRFETPATHFGLLKPADAPYPFRDPFVPLLPQGKAVHRAPE